MKKGPVGDMYAKKKNADCAVNGEWTEHLPLQLFSSSGRQTAAWFGGFFFRSVAESERQTEPRHALGNRRVAGR